MSVRSFATMSASKSREDAEITHARHGFLDALFALKMAIVTFDSGVTFKAWLADGYLGEAGRSNARGNLKYFDLVSRGDQEIPKSLSFFKNRRVHSLVPHGPVKKWSRISTS